MRHAAHDGRRRADSRGALRPWRPLVAAAVLGAGALGLSACGTLDDLLSVEAPDRIQAESLERPENAVTLLAGAIADFECAFGQYVVFGGTFTEELQWSLGVESWRPIDAREMEESGFNAAHAISTCDVLHQGDTPGLYKVMSIARWQADHVLDLLAEWQDEEVPQREMVEARAAAYAGYATLLLGEAMCTAAFDLGPEQTPPEIFARAEERFTRAIQVAQAAGIDDVVNMARVGRARVRQNLGDLAGAKADAEAVPQGFVLNADYSTIAPRRENWVFVFNNRDNNATVQAPFRTLDDPRVPVQDQERLSGRGIPMFYQLKYATASSPIPLATWEEARLIVAEAELEAGNLAAAVAAINDIRTRSGVDLPPFASSDPGEIRQQLLEERKLELFLESHRMGDVRRYELDLVPPAGTPYPIGGTYGDQRCLPLPRSERLNNPNI